MISVIVLCFILSCDILHVHKKTVFYFKSHFRLCIPDDTPIMKQSEFTPYRKAPGKQILLYTSWRYDKINSGRIRFCMELHLQEMAQQKRISVKHSYSTERSNVYDTDNQQFHNASHSGFLFQGIDAE